MYNRVDSKTVFTDSNRQVPFRVKLTKNNTTEWFNGYVGPEENVTCFKFNFTEGSGAIGRFIVLPGQSEKLTFNEHCIKNRITYNKGEGFYALVKKEKNK